MTSPLHPGTHRSEEALAESRAALAASLSRPYRDVPDDDESADEAEEELDDENDQTYCEQGAAKRRRVLIDDVVPDAVLARCRPVRRGAAPEPYPV